MKYCTKCQKEYDDSWSICLNDSNILIPLEYKNHETPKILPKCIHCQTDMFKSTKKDLSIGMLIFGIITLPIIIGIFFIIGAFSAKSIPIWKCKNCAYYFKIA